MDVQELQVSMERIKGILLPWQATIANPVAVQEKILQENLKIYTQTEYGKQHQAERISSLEDFRSKFPVMTHADYKPLIARVVAGETHLFLERRTSRLGNHTRNRQRRNQVHPHDRHKPENARFSRAGGVELCPYQAEIRNF
jgi:hypothetical protein